MQHHTNHVLSHVSKLCELGVAVQVHPTLHRKNTEGKLICMEILMATDPHPQCSLPVMSLSDGHRQKGHEPGCGFGKIVHSLYHQGL